MSVSRAVVFLDRDGTLIEDTGYLRDPEPIELLPFVADGLHEFRRKGFFLFLVSNQSGVGRGIISDSQFRAVHQKLIDLLRSNQLSLDGFAYCFHKPDDHCECRKPKPGLIPTEVAGFSVDYGRSLVVGDRSADIDLARAIGAQSYLVLSGAGRETLATLPLQLPCRVAQNLLEIALSIPLFKVGYN